MKKIWQKYLHPLIKADENDNQSDKQLDIYVATCALLLEMASIDGEFNAIEQQRITRLMISAYHLPVEYVQKITEIAREELAASHDLWRFTNLINQHYTPAEKIKVIKLVWDILYSDGRMDKHEDYLVHKLSRLLNLKHSELIDAKLQILEKNK